MEHLWQTQQTNSRHLLNITTGKLRWLSSVLTHTETQTHSRNTNTQTHRHAHTDTQTDICWIWQRVNWSDYQVYYAHWQSTMSNHAKYDKALLLFHTRHTLAGVKTLQQNFAETFSDSPLFTLSVAQSAFSVQIKRKTSKHMCCILLTLRNCFDIHFANCI